MTCLAENRIASPLKWHGGKGAFSGKLAKWIVSLMPTDHVHYVEPYFGGGSVLLNKNPNGVSEVVNDLHEELTNFWEVLQNDADYARFQRIVESTPFSENEWNRECIDGSPVWSAATFFIRCRQSLAGRMDTFAPLSRTRTRGGMNEQVSAWLTAIEGLPEVHARLKRVVILNRPALEVIQSQDGPQTLCYLDPPYLHETRATTGEYEHEMTAEDHDDLLLLLSQIEGRFVLSGYRSELYDQAALAYGWKCHEFEIVNNAAGGKTKRNMTECVWTNY